MATFQLHPQLAADTFHVRDLPLSALLLMNDRRFPWLIMVPRRAGLVELIDMADDDRTQVWREIDAVSRIVKTQFHADKLNVAALGNVVPQLHVHVIARSHSDAAWPRPIWGVGIVEPYDQDEVNTVIAKLNAALGAAGL